jgi:hypothetical protein
LWLWLLANVGPRLSLPYHFLPLFSSIKKEYLTTFYRAWVWDYVRLQNDRWLLRANSLVFKWLDFLPILWWLPNIVLVGLWL